MEVWCKEDYELLRKMYETLGPEEAYARCRLAAVRWTAPVIVLGRLRVSRRFINDYFDMLEYYGLRHAWEYGSILAFEVTGDAWWLRREFKAVHLFEKHGKLFAFVGPEYYNTPVRKLYTKLMTEYVVRIKRYLRRDHSIVRYLSGLGYAAIYWPLLLFASRNPDYKKLYIDLYY